MKQEELNNLKSQLEVEKVEILKQLREGGVEDPAVKGNYEAQKPEYGTDETDDASEIADFERNSAIIRELETRLRGIDDALKKIDEGTYGKCVDCSVKIPAKRLQAIPLASLCLSCASGNGPRKI